MTTLSSFTPEEADLIISLPYRVGMNVSYSEDEGGELDDVLEMKALEAALREAVQKSEEGSLVHEVARATLQSKDKWEAWSQGVFNIEPLCEKAVVMLKTKANTDEIKGYISMCLAVANGVALAYGEFGEDTQEESSGIIGKIMAELSKVMPKAKGQEAHHPMNVSAAEDSSIERIRAALKKALSA
jgi:hypothetical protein